MHVSHRTSTQIRLEGEIVDQLGANPEYVHLGMVNFSRRVYKTSSSGVMIESEHTLLLCLQTYAVRSD